MEDSEILDLLSDLDSVALGDHPLSLRLRIVREIQAKMPNSHLGGSLGLFLQGIDLKRDFVGSDLDFCFPDTYNSILPSDKSQNPEFLQTEEAKSSTDMDHCVLTSISPKGSPGVKVKIEINVDKSQSYKTVTYEGNTYRVTNPEVVLGWKVVFASRGSEKHRKDLDLLGVDYLKGFTLPWGSEENKFKGWWEVRDFLDKLGLGGKNLQISAL